MTNKIYTTTVAELIAKLQRLGSGSANLPVVGVCGSSGTSYEVGSCCNTETTKNDDCGLLCDVPVNTQYVRLSLGN